MTVTFTTYDRVTRVGDILKVVVMDGDEGLDHIGPVLLQTKSFPQNYLQSIGVVDQRCFAAIPHKLFVKLSKPMLEVILLHEEGHYVLGHDGSITDSKVRDHMEVEADAYTGKSPEVLRQMIEFSCEVIESCGGRPRDVNVAMACVLSPKRMGNLGYNASLFNRLKHQWVYFKHFFMIEFKKRLT